MQRYVVGFAFSHSKDDVVLIKKERPAWQRGKLNGVGGKVDNGEELAVAMSREFQEETGVTIPPKDWQPYATLSGIDYHVTCFRAVSGQVYNVESMTDEAVRVINVRAALDGDRIISNLSYLIPLALDQEVIPGTTDFHYKTA